MEWRPHGSPVSESGSRVDVEVEDDHSDSGGVEEEEREEGREEKGEEVEEEGEDMSQVRIYQDCLYETRGPVTVSIDPPEDQVGVDVSHLSGSDSEAPVVVFQSPRSETEPTEEAEEEEEEEEENLWAGLSSETEYESDMEDEEIDRPACVCLLSR